MLLKERLARGESVYGMMLSEIYVPNVVTMIARCGFAFVIVDCEHGYFDKVQVANLAAVARGEALPLIVRVAELSETDIPQYLDMGADGILLANTRDAQDARALASLCRYAPVGDRGISTFRAHTRYDGGDVTSVMRQANERTLVLCQIESAEAAMHSAEILEVEGIDGALIGPNDMSQRMGIFGQYTDERMLGAMRQVAQSASAAHKFSGIITSSDALIRECKRMGMSWYSVGSELNYLVDGGKRALAKAVEIGDD